MLTLLLMRHAKAEAVAGKDDFARDLAAAGERDAGFVGDFIVEHRLAPDLALVSTSRRTMQTMELVIGRLAARVVLQQEPALYNAGESLIGRHIVRTPPDISRLMVVGHNPGIMELAVTLARDGDLAEVERLRGRFPPGGLVVLAFEAEDWPSALSSGGRLDALIFPEDLIGSK